MNKSILSFFAGVCLVILTAAATGVTEFKPSMPKNTVAITGPSEYCKQSIVNYARAGFQVKSVSVTYDSGCCEQLFIVMEKY